MALELLEHIVSWPVMSVINGELRNRGGSVCERPYVLMIYWLLACT